MQIPNNRLISFLAKYLPMTFKASLFVDQVSGEGVKLYTQIDGKEVMAEHAFALFRVDAADEDDCLETVIEEVEADLRDK